MPSFHHLIFYFFCVFSFFPGSSYFFFSSARCWRNPWIISFFPPHKIYVEPFGGSGAVLLNKKPAWMEVYNALYDRVVNFFEVLRDTEKSARLASLLELTPYAQAAYALSLIHI